MKQSRDIMKVNQVLIISLFSNLLLVILKIMVGFFGKSKTLIADGVHSLSDMSTDFVAIIGNYLSNKPADKHHPFGHGRIEYLTSIVIGCVIIFVGLGIIFTSFNSPLQEPNNIVVLVAMIAIVFKSFIANLLLRYGKKYNNNILISSGKESKANILTSIIVIISFIISKLSVYNDIFLYSDLFGSLLISLFVIYIGYNILKDNIISILGEKEIDKEYLANIKNIILENDKVLKIIELNIMKYGSYYQAFITLGLDKNTSLASTTKITKELKRKLANKKTRINYIKINYNPCMEDKNA